MKNMHSKKNFDDNSSFQRTKEEEEEEEKSWPIYITKREREAYEEKKRLQKKRVRQVGASLWQAAVKNSQGFFSTGKIAEVASHPDDT